MAKLLASLTPLALDLRENPLVASRLQIWKLRLGEDEGLSQVFLA